MTLDPRDLAPRRIDVGEVELEVVEAGEGPAVLLLHGWPETWWTWHRLIPDLVAAGYRVVAPNQRGYGGSDRPRRVRSYRAERLVRDAVGLLDALGLDRAHVVGHDWGGIVAWGVGMAQPERVDRLVVLNQTHPARMYEAIRSWRQARMSWYVGLFQIPFLPERVASRRRCALLRKLAWQGARADAFSEADIDRYVAAFGSSAGLGAPLHWYRALVRDVLRGTAPPIRPIRRPVLALFGQDDKATHRDFAEPHPHDVPDVRFVPVPGASHWVHHDAPELVRDEILAFLGR